MEIQIKLHVVKYHFDPKIHDFKQKIAKTRTCTLRAVGFSYAKRERNHYEQPSAFPWSMHEFVMPHMIHLMSISFVN